MKTRILRRTFTLMELMLVIAVAAILMSIGAGSLFSASQGSQVRQGCVALGGKCAVARSMAASTYSYVAVLLPTDALGDIPEQYASRSAVLCKVEMINKSVEGKKQFRFVDFIEGQTWAMLPEGAIILSKVPDIGNSSIQPEFVTKNTIGIQEVDIPNDRINSNFYSWLKGKKVPAIVFSPDGQPESEEIAGVILYVANGTILDKKFNGKAEDNRSVRINPFTGRADYDY